jgi:site-specific recombinase XerD
MKNKYSIPKLNKSKENAWYIHLRYEGVQKRYKKNLNLISDLKERERYFNLLSEALHEKLKQGWNPLVKEPEEVKEKIMTIVEALNFSLDKKKPKIAVKSYHDYSSTLSFIITAINKLEKSTLPINQLNRLNVKLILENMAAERKATNKTFNKYLDHFRAILGELIQWDIIEFNPAAKINYMPVGIISANITATPEQHLIIKNELQDKHLHFFRFIVTLFHTGIRPVEVLQIRLSMINMSGFEIILPPEITKTNKERKVPINQFLVKVFESMNFEKLPKDYYLFGAYKCNHKHRAKLNLDFLAGPLMLKRDTATKRWEKIVKIGLNIPVNMYSNKHAGANAKILAGMDLEALRELYGHSSKLTTKVYATAIQEVYRKEILDKSPDF